MKAACNVALAVLAAALVAGCKTVGGVKGSGPLTVAPNVAAGFETYKTKAKPLTFAVSTDGQDYSYYFCPGTPCDSSHATPEAIASCQGRSGGVPCKIFAIGREVVWDGPVKGLGGGGSATAALPKRLSNVSGKTLYLSFESYCLAGLNRPEEMRRKLTRDGATQVPDGTFDDTLGGVEQVWLIRDPTAHYLVEVAARRVPMCFLVAGGGEAASAEFEQLLRKFHSVTDGKVRPVEGRPVRTYSISYEVAFSAKPQQAVVASVNAKQGSHRVVMVMAAPEDKIDADTLAKFGFSASL